MTKLCFKNPENQKYFYNFTQVLFNHIDKKLDICSTFQKCFKDNEEIVRSFHKYPITFKKNDLKETKMIPETYLLEEIILKMKTFDKYSNYEMINLINDLLKVGDSAIFINQEIVFRKLIKDNEVNNEVLIQIAHKMDEIIVSYTNKYGN